MDLLQIAAAPMVPGAPSYLDKLLVPTAYLPWVAVAVVLLVALVGVMLLAINRWLTPGYSIGKSIRDNPLAVAVLWGLVLAAMVLVLGKFLERAAFGATDAYDAQFRRWGIHYFGDTVDWREFKAQGMTESGLRPRVCSAVGACGLMQHMPATAAELGIDPFDPRQAAEGGVRYMRWQWERWTAPRPPPERLAFAKAAYNAGLGHVLRFQRQARAAGRCDADRWLCVEPYAWAEPRDYVRRIARWCVRFHSWGCWPLATPEVG
jgi:membrane-bound lytic murein transglycosylase F